MNLESKVSRWITNGTAAPFYARRKFSLGKRVKRAEAKVCGLGQFVFWVNGCKVDDHELDPGWTDYKKLIEYVVFDVTDYLFEGENVIGAEVGNGWFLKMDEHYTFSFPSFMPPNPNPYQPYGKTLVLAVRLDITYEDGTELCLMADEDWCVKKHPIVMSNVYGSETMDGRLVPGSGDSGSASAENIGKAYKGKGNAAEGFWCTAEYEDASWERASFVGEADAPAGRLIRQMHPPVKVIRTYEGKFLCEANGRKIYDFGQNLSGILEFEAKGHTGDVVKVYPAEKLTADGDVDQMAKNWVNLDVCETYIIGTEDKWERFRMKFTYFAGRYVAVEKLSANEKGQEHADPFTEDDRSPLSVSETDIQVRGIVAHALTSAFQTDGSFTCDDERYNQIYVMIEKTVEANMTSGVHTDCPTIERFAWQEPNHLMAPSIFFMKDGKALWEKFLLDMRTGQHTADDWFYDLQGGKFYPGDGLMPAQCPCYIPNVLPVPGMGSFYDIIAWGSTCILGTYWHYQFYGDPRIIADNYDAGLRYLEHLKTKVTADGFISHGLGDWGNPRNDLVKENVETAFLYADVMTLAGFAEVLGRDKDREALLAYGEEIRKNYNEKLLVWVETPSEIAKATDKSQKSETDIWNTGKDKERGFWCYRAWDHPDDIFLTQATEALPLYWGLVPEDKEEDVARALRYVLKQDGALISGEVGLPYVIQSMRKYGMNDTIAQLILKEEHPSYYAFILDGETTLGEYWEKNPRSHCHDMMGHIIEWYYNGIAGILCEEPGFRKITIRPYLPESMTEFTCSYESVQGRIQVRVQETEITWAMEAGADEAGNLSEDVPQGTTCAERVIRLDVTLPEQIECRIDTEYLEKRGKTKVKLLYY